MQNENDFISEEMKELLEKQDQESKENTINQIKTNVQKRKQLYLFISTIWGITIGFLIMDNKLISVSFGISIGLLVGLSFSKRLDTLTNKKMQIIDKQYEQKENITGKGIIWEGPKKEKKREKEEEIY